MARTKKQKKAQKSIDQKKKDQKSEDLGPKIGPLPLDQDVIVSGTDAIPDINDGTPVLSYDSQQIEQVRIETK